MLKFGIIYTLREEPEVEYSSYIYATDKEDAFERLEKFPSMLSEYIAEIFIIHPNSFDCFNVKECDKTSFLFQYFQRDILPKEEKEGLREYLLEKEYYEFLINF